MRRPSGGAAATIAALGGIVLASIALRWPGFTQGGFANHDVAGILYNAMLLCDGALPYVDSIELKAPGTFYLAALLAGPEGRDIAAFQGWANAWAITSLIAVAAIGWRLWGRRAAVIAAAVYGLGDAFLDSMDANYVTWAQLPQILAMAAALAALRAPTAATGRWALAGALAGAATLCKQPDGAVLLPIVMMAGAAGGGAGRERARAVAAALAGFVLAHLPIVAHYALAGGLDALIRGYFLSEWGAAYIARRAQVGPWIGLREAGLATVYFLALPLFLALWTGLSGQVRGRRDPIPWLWAWFLATLLAASVGLRFYKGYFVAAAPPLALLAAAPGGLLRGPGRRWIRAIGLALAGLLTIRALALELDVRADRGRAHDRGGRAIAAYIADRSAPDDRIWVWGWHLWDVYPLAGRRSGSRIYKSLGLLSTINEDTWRTPAAPLRMAEGSPYPALLIADLEASRPRYIALGSTVPRDQFTALRELLARDYVRDRGLRVGRVELWRRRE
ncbi:MAG: hypothetical protein R3B09_29010 [Nannocystaceae bacterium]